MGMLAAIAGSTVISVRPESSVSELLLWLMYLTFFSLAAFTLSGTDAARRFIDAVVAMGGWLCLIAMFLFWGANNPTMRWYSTFYWPNPFAGFLLLLLPIAVARYLHARGIRELFAHGAISLLLAVALVLTYSRGAWVSLALTFPIAVVVLSPTSWVASARRFGVLAFFGAAVVVILTRATVLENSMRGLQENEGTTAILGDLSIQGRLAFWSSGVRMFVDHPVLGTGAGTFGAAHPFYQRDVRFYAKDAHNRYLQTAAELGVVGLGALIGVVVSITMLWRHTLQSTRHREEYPIVAGIGLGLLAFALHSAVDMDWAFPAAPAMAFALIGVLEAYAKMNAGRGSVGGPVGGLAWRTTWVTGLIIAVGSIQALHVAQGQFDVAQRLAQSGQWLAATDRYSAATRWNPLSARAWGGVANAAIHLSPPRQDLAESSLRRAIALDRMDAGYPLQLATVLMVQSVDPTRAREAEALLLQALRLDPRNRPETYRVLAQFYIRVGRFADARRIYGKAIARYRGYSLGRGSLLYASLWPQVTNLFLEAADFSVRRGNVLQAVETLRELLDEDPASVAAAVRLAALYVQLGRSSDARRVLEATAAHVPDNEEIRATLRGLP